MSYLEKNSRQLASFAASHFCKDAKALSPNIEKLAKEIPPGIFGQPAQVIVVIDTSTIAGGGPSTWAQNNQEFLSGMATGSGIPFIKIAVGSGRPAFASNGLTGEFLEPDYPLLYPTNCSVAERFTLTVQQVQPVVEQLAQQGIKNIFSFSEGYTGYGPFALAVAVRESNRKGNNVKINIVYQDNCLPDTDRPGWNIEDRFFPGTYCGIPNMVNIFALGVFGTPVKPGAEIARSLQFPGLKYIETAYNFTPAYINRLTAFFQSLTDQKARILLQDAFTLPTNQRIPIVSSLGNGAYWKKQPWMTEPQQEDVLRGTDTIVASLQIASEKIKSPIALVAAQEAADYIRDKKLPVSFSETKLAKTGVLIIPRAEIAQDKFLALKKISSFEFGRSRGNNAVAESALMGKPVIVVIMPNNNYMGVTQMDPLASIYDLPVFTPDADQKRLGSLAAKFISNPNYAQQIGAREQELFFANYKENNYFKVVRYLAGLWER